MTASARTRLVKIGVIVAVAAIWFATAEAIATGVLPLGRPEKIWLPSGLALGIVTVAGGWASLGVVLGAGIYWITRGASIPVAVLVAVVDGAEAAIGAYILIRVINVRLALARVRDVIGLLATALVISAGSALEASLVMAIFGGAPVHALAGLAPTWWWAHFSAQVIVVPPILVFAARGVRRLASGAPLELACLALAVIVVGAGVFDARLWASLPVTPRSYYLFPLLMWAGLRWDLRVGAIVNLAISTMAIASWVAGVSPFPSLTALHGFITICAVTTLVLAALRSERLLAAVREAALHEGALDAIVTVGPDGKIVDLNPAALSLFGLRAASAVGCDAASLLVPQPLRAQVREAIAYYAHDGSEGSISSRRIRFPLLRADGEEFPAEVALSRVRLQGEVWFTSFVRDITAERNAEQSRRESRELLEHKVHERTLELISANEELKRRDELLRQAQQLAKIGSFDFDVVTAQFQWSEELVRILGRDPASLEPTYDGVLACVHPEDRPRVRTILEATMQRRQAFSFEARVVRPDASLAVVLCRGQVAADSRGAVLRIAGYCQDITDQKAAEHRVWVALREKEILLREIHHRVKNNLQVISSLLNLQLQRLGNADAREALVESASRIRSMALVHQMLYRSKDLGHINFLEYLQTVVASLVAMYGAQAARIDHVVTGDPVDLDVDRAIVCGLIVTELVTNSLRHAFPHGKGGHVMVAARRTGTDVSLEVRDDGIGLPDNARAGQVSSFGLQIARALADQLEGAIDVDVDHGTCISIRFPLESHDEIHAPAAEPLFASPAC